MPSALGQFRGTHQQSRIYDQLLQIDIDLCERISHHTQHSFVPQRSGCRERSGSFMNEERHVSATVIHLPHLSESDI